MLENQCKPLLGSVNHNDTVIPFVRLSDLVTKWEDTIVVSFKFTEGARGILRLLITQMWLENQEDYNSTVYELHLPYIPYSRMDRFEEKRLCTLKYFSHLVNQFNYDKVVVMEPHSTVSEVLIDRVYTINKSMEIANSILKDLEGQEGVYLVYPDEGASKRYRKQTDYKNVITCEKVRDFYSGNLLSFKVGDAKGDISLAIIVDDLSSKGGTFMGTAKAIKEKYNVPVWLIVAHCENTIFEGGVLTTDLIDKVYTTDSMLDLEQIKKFSVEKLLTYNLSKLTVEKLDIKLGGGK